MRSVRSQSNPRSLSAPRNYGDRDRPLASRPGKGGFGPTGGKGDKGSKGMNGHKGGKGTRREPSLGRRRDEKLPSSAAVTAVTGARIITYNPSTSGTRGEKMLSYAEVLRQKAPPPRTSPAPAPARTPPTRPDVHRESWCDDTPPFTPPTAPMENSTAPPPAEASSQHSTPLFGPIEPREIAPLDPLPPEPKLLDSTALARGRPAQEVAAPVRSRSATRQDKDRPRGMSATRRGRSPATLSEKGPVLRNRSPSAQRSQALFEEQVEQVVLPLDMPAARQSKFQFCGEGAEEVLVEKKVIEVKEVVREVEKPALVAQKRDMGTEPEKEPAAPPATTKAAKKEKAPAAPAPAPAQKKKEKDPKKEKEAKAQRKKEKKLAKKVTAETAEPEPKEASPETPREEEEEEEENTSALRAATTSPLLEAVRKTEVSLSDAPGLTESWAEEVDKSPAPTSPSSDKKCDGRQNWGLGISAARPATSHLGLDKTKPVKVPTSQLLTQSSLSSALTEASPAPPAPPAAAPAPATTHTSGSKAINPNAAPFQPAFDLSRAPFMQTPNFFSPFPGGYSLPAAPTGANAAPGSVGSGDPRKDEDGKVFDRSGWGNAKMQAQQQHQMFGGAAPGMSGFTGPSAVSAHPPVGGAFAPPFGVMGKPPSSAPNASAPGAPGRKTDTDAMANGAYYSLGGMWQWGYPYGYQGYAYPGASQFSDASKTPYGGQMPAAFSQWQYPGAGGKGAPKSSQPATSAPLPATSAAPAPATAAAPGKGMKGAKGAVAPPNGTLPVSQGKGAKGSKGGMLPITIGMGNPSVPAAQPPLQPSSAAPGPRTGWGTASAHTGAPLAPFPGQQQQQQHGKGAKGGKPTMPPSQLVQQPLNLPTKHGTPTPQAQLKIAQQMASMKPMTVGGISVPFPMKAPGAPTPVGAPPARPTPGPALHGAPGAPVPQPHGIPPAPSVPVSLAPAAPIGTSTAPGSVAAGMPSIPDGLRAGSRSPEAAPGVVSPAATSPAPEPTPSADVAAPVPETTSTSDVAAPVPETAPSTDAAPEPAPSTDTPEVVPSTDSAPTASTSDAAAPVPETAPPTDVAPTPEDPADATPADAPNTTTSPALPAAPEAEAPTDDLDVEPMGSI